MDRLTKALPALLLVAVGWYLGSVLDRLSWLAVSLLSFLFGVYMGIYLEKEEKRSWETILVFATLLIGLGVHLSFLLRCKPAANFLVSINLLPMVFGMLIAFMIIWPICVSLDQRRFKKDQEVISLSVFLFLGLYLLILVIRGMLGCG